MLVIIVRLKKNKDIYFFKIDMPKLYIVPTPVGNLGDITLRALEVLKTADFILAEDTRTSQKLLNHFEIKNKLFSYHKYNEHQKLDSIIQLLRSGNFGALISDAGTPGISDPGFLMVRECLQQGIEVECLPGATALIPALVASGLPADRFIFEGFLPQKKGRKSRIQLYENETRTLIFYESPFRLVKTLTEFSEILGLQRNASVAREISKIYEENKRGTLQDLINHYTQKPPKGEIVIIIEGKQKHELKEENE